MSNRVDFFQSAQKQLSVPAGRVTVFLDGSVCPYLEPVELVQSGWPEFGWARLVYNPAAGDTIQVRAEEIETILPTGGDVRIEQVYHSCVPDVGVDRFVLFTGQIEAIETSIGPKGERVEIVVKDFSAVLKRINVYGRQIYDIDGTSIFLGSTDTIFNEDGKPNSAIEQVESQGKTLTVFSPGSSEGKYWGYAEAIQYLLGKYAPNGQLQIPGLEHLRNLTKNQKVRNLNVTGSNLLDALHKCCERIGLAFGFVARKALTGPGQAMVFYRNGQGRIVELNYQQNGEQLTISKTDIVKLDSRRNLWPVTHRYIGQGDFKVYEATFELVKAWDPNLEGADYDKFSSSTNPDFHQVMDVYRKWCLNEAGDYTNTPYNRGQAFDFSKIFDYKDYVHRRRRFRQCLTRDSLGKSLGYFLEVSFDNGQTWHRYLHSFNNLKDECGIWLSSDKLDVDTWSAAQDGTLKFRMTASVVSDQPLSCEVADGPVNSTAEVVEYLVTLSRQFKYRKVSCQSIFYGNNDSSPAEPDEIDDSQALYEFVRNKAQANSGIIEIIDARTPYPALYYQPGDRVTSSPESRDILGCKTDNRSTFWIKRLQTVFEKQCTNIKIVRQRILP